MNYMCTFILFYQELNIQNEDAIHIHIATVSSSSKTSSIPTTNPPSTGSAQNNSLSSIISSLIQGIKVPNKQPTADRDRIMADNIFKACAETHRLDYLRAEHPELAAAYEANPNDPGFIQLIKMYIEIISDAFYAAFLNFKDETARRARVMQDENSEEGQRYIAELIQRQNIEYMV